MTRVAVAILNFNGENLLRQFLPAVIGFSGNAAIYVIDNGSTDQSTTVISNEFPAIRLIPLNNNFGFCGGYNRGLQQIDADYYVLLNSDIEVTPGWLSPLQDILDNAPQIAAVQPKVLSFHQRNKFEYAGAGGGYIDALGYPFCRGRLFQHLEDDRGQYDDSREIFWATGACLMIRSAVYKQFGGLDEDFFAHMEEIDLCWKINRTSLKVFYCGSSTVYHVGAGTLSYESPRKTYLNFRNGLTLLYKHYDPGELWYKLPLRIALDWIASFKFLLSGKFNNAGSILRAHLHFLKDIRKHHSKRKAIRHDYPQYSRRNIYQGIILNDYFLLGRKTVHFNNPK